MSAKSSLSVCPKCGTTLQSTAAEGLCPRCLFAQLGTDDAPPEENDAAAVPSDATARSEARLRPEFGDYELAEEIGQGGMGTVYRACQLSLNRAVAIKVIKPGMDTRAVIARFEAERQALALMDHPGIARVFDAGATEAGRPYFAMELVRGARITEYCGRHRLSVRARLELFIKVCQAVQHAHQKGIIHRDLKPSNILVTELDGEAVPKVIDFGIAKATETRLTDQTAFTWAGQLVGTPAYLSPEQAELGGLDIDTRSDIYSLGVLLYELLTGHLPFDTKQLAKSSLDEVRRIIREQQPLRPSTRLSRELAANESTAAAHSKIKNQKSKIPSDLDWIVMKCLEKERSRRYATANGLAADLQRFLNNEPVLARPPSRLYEFQKSVRRHWAGFAAVAAVLVILASGVLISTLEAVRARQAEQRERKVVYAAKIGLVQAAWEQNRVAQVRELLEETADYPDRGFEWYYWQRQAHLELKTLRGHLDDINAVAFSPDGQRIVTGSRDTTAKIWEAVSGHEVLTLTGHVHRVFTAAYSSDGRRIVTGSDDTTARIWDAATGKALVILRGHTAGIETAVFSADDRRVVTSSDDSTARIWDAATGNLLLTLTGHAGPVDAAFLFPDGRQVVTGGRDESIRFWDASTGKELPGRQIHTGGTVWCLALSANGRLIASGGGEDHTAKVWDASTGSLLATLAGHQGTVNSLVFSPDGRRVATVSADQTAKVWDATTGKELLTLAGHEANVNDVAYSPDGKHIVTGSSDRTAKVWDAARDRAVLTLKGHDESVLTAAFSPDGQWIATGSADQTAKVWDAATGKLLVTLQGRHTEPVSTVAFSPDGRRIVTCSRDQTAVVWEAVDGRPVFTLHGHSGPVHLVAFSPNGQLIATGGGDRTVMLWEAASGKHLRTLKEHNGGIIALAFSEDSRRIVAGGLDQKANVWDVASGRVVSTLKVQDETLSRMAFSADGRRIVTGSADGTVMVWEAGSHKSPLLLKGHSGTVFSVTFSPDERRILTASIDGTAKLWDAASGVELLSLRDAGFYVAAFSPDGRRIVTGGGSGLAKVWSAATTEQLAVWREEEKRAAERAAALAGARAVVEQNARSNSMGDPGAIKQWLILGPIGFGGVGAEALAQEQIPNEAQLHPSAGERIRADARDWRWQEVQLRDYLIDFKSISQATGHPFVAYAVCYIESKAPQSNLVIKVGSQDRSRIYLNGRQIYSSEKPQQYVPDQEFVTGVELKNGLNTLVFKLLMEYNTCRASLRFTDAAGDPLKDIRVTLTPPP